MIGCYRKINRSHWEFNTQINKLIPCLCFGYFCTCWCCSKIHDVKGIANTLMFSLLSAIRFNNISITFWKSARHHFVHNTPQRTIAIWNTASHKTHSFPLQENILLLWCNLLLLLSLNKLIFLYSSLVFFIMDRCASSREIECAWSCCGTEVKLHNNDSTGLEARKDYQQW